jgi:hypothetical protein
MAKIMSFLVMLMANVAIGVALFVMLIVIRNGFSERDAIWGIYAYVGPANVASPVLAALAAVSTGLMVKRNVHPVLCAVVPIIGFSVLGVVVKSVLMSVGMAIAEIVRSSS